MIIYQFSVEIKSKITDPSTKVIVTYTYVWVKGLVILIQYSFRGFRNFHAGHRAEKAWTRLVMVAVAVTSEASTACHR